MKTFSLITLAVTMVVASADGGIRGFIPKLFGADQLIDIEAHCEGCQPDYCYAPTAPDFYCYKNGYPKCCTKNKGNCPNNKQPGCECTGSCNPGGEPPEFARCGNNDDCTTRDQFCMYNSGTCGRNYGICWTYPQMCSAENDPVCGCNGREYGNACQAAAAGVSIKYVGEC